jgi:hypothetical protein
MAGVVLLSYEEQPQHAAVARRLAAIQSVGVILALLGVAMIAAGS